MAQSLNRIKPMKFRHVKQPEDFRAFRPFRWVGLLGLLQHADE